MQDLNGTVRSLRPSQPHARDARISELRAHSAQSAMAGKIIDWEAFHYGMLDHKFLNDPNPATADHRRTIYELWVGELIEAVNSGEIQIFSKDGKLPRRLAAAQAERRRDADILIGCLFSSEKLLKHMEAYFIKNREL